MAEKSELYNLTIKEASEKLATKEISAVDLTQSCLDRIKEKEPEINAFITITEEVALEKAAQIDKARENDEGLGPLAGIPYSLKDVYVTEGIRTTAGSKILDDYIPQYSATVVKKLDDAGAVLVGKTNCDPFGFGSSTENSAYGISKNPVDTTRVAGGSSGGSGAAVAYGGGLFSIGEDTGGSIRCPASFCGLSGLKPTYGRVSRYGSIAYASSYDSVGPITKNVEDASMVLQVIAGQDPKDSTSQPGDIPEYSELLKKELKGKVIGLPKEYFGEGLDPEVKRIVMDAVEKYRNMGVEVKEMSLPHTDYAVATYYIVGISEASSNLARFDGIRYGIKEEAEDWKERIRKTRGVGFGDEEKRRIMIGTYALSAGYADQYYNQAQKVRAILRKEILEAFKEVDIILTPTMPMPAFKIGEKASEEDDLQMLQLWLADAFTVTVNPVGVPALSVNAGNTNEGLPVGMQLIAPHFMEERLFNFGYMFENL